MRRRLIETGFVAAGGAGAVLASQLIWSPPPIAAATTVGGGVLLFAVAARRPSVVIGAALGWALGVALHVRSHAIEDRIGEAAAFTRHLLADGASGALIGGVGLVAGLAAVAWWSRADGKEAAGGGVTLRPPE